MILSFWLRLCRTASLPLCVFALTAFVGFKHSERTCSTFLLPFTLYRWTESVTCTGSLGAIRVPANHVREPNRCNLEPLKPETPKIALYVAVAQGRLTLQVVCLGLAHFQLPVRPPKSPSPPTGENPGRPGGREIWCGGMPRAET